MLVFSLIFEDGYHLDGNIKCLNELKEFIIDTIEDSESENENFVLTISKLCH